MATDFLKDSPARRRLTTLNVRSIDDLSDWMREQRRLELIDPRSVWMHPKCIAYIRSISFFVGSGRFPEIVDIPSAVEKS